MAPKRTPKNKPYMRPGVSEECFRMKAALPLSRQWPMSCKYSELKSANQTFNQQIGNNSILKKSFQTGKGLNSFHGQNVAKKFIGFSQQTTGNINRSQGQTATKEGIGMSMLKKMGWTPGEGLGKNKEGNVEPLLLDVKLDKRGLVSKGEGPQVLITPALESLGGKHPVSALQELCLKRRWQCPRFTVVNECGPSHKKCYLFKVRVNDVDYQPARIIANKKQAKALAATVCLQALGVVPENSDNPGQTA